jgi:hypothetical protein
MKMRTVISTVLAAFAAGGFAGYWFRAYNSDSSLVLSTKDLLSDEYVTPPDTFSRIKNTRNALDSLSTRVALGITDTLAAHDRLPRTSEVEKKKAQEVLERAIRAGQAAMQEFEGTPQQLVIVPAFLRALRVAGQFNRWIEVYVQTLYTHPTDPVLCSLGQDAVKIGKLCGQLQEVLEALRYVSACPAEFAGRAEVQAALTSAFVSASEDAPLQPGKSDCPHSFNCLQL